MEENLNNDIEQNDEFTEVQQVRKVADLTRELAESAKNYAIVSTAYNLKRARNSVEKSVEELRQNITEQAKQFGIKLDESDEKSRVAKEQVEKVIGEYKEALSGIHEVYNEEKENIALEVANNKTQMAEIPGEILELKSRRKYLIKTEQPDLAQKIDPVNKKIKELRKLAAEAIKYGADERAQKLMGEIDFLKDKITEFEEKFSSEKEKYTRNLKKIDSDIEAKKQELKDSKERAKALKDLDKEIDSKLKEEIKSATIKKDVSLKAIENNTIMDKLKGFFARTFKSQKARSEDFNKKVIETVSKKVNEVKTKIPEIKEKISKDVQNKKDTIVDKAKQFVGGVREGIDIAKDTKQRIQKDMFLKGEAIKEGFKEKVNDAIDFGKSVRNGAIDRMVAATEKMNEKAHAMQDKMNEKPQIDAQEASVLE